MSRKSLVAQSLIASLLLTSLVIVPAPVAANDLVPSDDLVGGTSVFVFRGSSKKPQGGAGTVNASRAQVKRGSPARSLPLESERRMRRRLVPRKWRASVLLSVWRG